MGKSITDLSSVATVGLDLAKQSLKVTALMLRRGFWSPKRWAQQTAEFFASLPACLVGLQASGPLWPQVFEKFRRVVMSASMIAVRGRIQREGEVVHLVAHRLVDLSAELATVVSRDAAFPLPHGRGDQVTHGGGSPDPRELPPKGLRTRDIYVPDLHIDIIKARSRNFH
jgi:hypothetical protein